MKSNDVMGLKQELIAEIVELDVIATYLTVQEKLLKHEKVQRLIEDKKQKQKELVNAQKIGKIELITLLEVEIKEIEEELFAIPIYQQFLSASEDAQEVLAEISEYINWKLEQLIK